MSDIVHNAVVEPVELSVEQELEQALVKASVTDEDIAKLMKRALEHDHDIDTPEKYQAAERARLDIKKVRGIGEKAVEAIDERYLRLRQMSLAKKKEILARLNEPELIILNRTRAYEAEQKRKEEEEKAAITAMKEQRRADVQALGYTLVAGPPAHHYVLEGTVITVSEIIEADHETWGNLFRGLRMHAEEVQERKDRERQEEEKKEAERKALIAERADNRREVLVSLGCELSGQWWVYGGHMIVDDNSLGSLDKENWDGKRARVQEVKDAQAEEAERAAKAEQERVANELLAQERSAINDERAAELQALGAMVSKTGNIGVDAIYNWPIKELWMQDAETWERTKKSVADILQEQKDAKEREEALAEERQKEAVRIAGLQAERAATIKAIPGVVVSDANTVSIMEDSIALENLGNLSEEDWQNMVKRWGFLAVQKKKQEERVAEQARLASEALRSDGVKWAEYKQTLLAVALPGFSSAEHQHAGKTLRQYIADFGKNL